MTLSTPIVPCPACAADGHKMRPDGPIVCRTFCGGTGEVSSDRAEEIRQLFAASSDWHTTSAAGPTEPVTLESICAVVAALTPPDKPIARTVYIRTDAWPAFRAELETAGVRRVDRPFGFPGGVGFIGGVELVVAEAPLPRPWMFDYEMGLGAGDAAEGGAP